MLRIAAEKLLTELRGHIAREEDGRSAPDTPEYVVLADPAARGGPRGGSPPRDRVVVSLVRLVPDAALRSAPGAAPGSDGRGSAPIGLEADFLISADYADYGLALRRIDRSFAFLSDGLAFGLETEQGGHVRMTAATVPLALEDLGRLWLSFRARARPGFVVRVRLVTASVRGR